MLASEKKLQARLHQLLFDKTSGCKGKVRDKHFAGLNFNCVLSRYIAHTEEQQREKPAKVSEAKSKFFRNTSHGDWDFGHCRRSTLSTLCRSGYETYIFSQNIEAYYKNIWLCGHEIGIEVLHEFIVYTPDVALSSRNDATRVDGTIHRLARLNAYRATIMICHHGNCFDNVGGHCQKIYNNTFASFLSITFIQLIGVIASYIGTWCSEKLGTCLFSSQSTMNGPSTNHGAALHVFVTSVNRHLLSVFTKRFSQHISAKIEEFHDPHIAKYGPSTKMITILGNPQGGQTIPLQDC